MDSDRAPDAYETNPFRAVRAGSAGTGVARSGAMTTGPGGPPTRWWRARPSALVVLTAAIGLGFAAGVPLAPHSPVESVVFDVVLLNAAPLVASLLCTALGAESEAAVVAGLILLGLGWSASTVAGSALLTESTAPERRPVIQGRSDLLMSGSGAVGGLLAGPTLAALGYSGLSFVTLGLVAVVVALLALTPRAAGGAAPRR